jgi:hypothetical protein
MIDRDAEHAAVADRFAREIGGFLTRFSSALAAAKRQPVRHLGNVIGTLFLMWMRRNALQEHTLCWSRGVPVLVVPEWYDCPLCGLLVVLRVVRRLVVLLARCGQRAHMLRVVPISTRCAGRDRVLNLLPTEQLVVEGVVLC